MESNRDDEIGQNEEEKFIEKSSSDEDKGSRSSDRSRSKELTIVPQEKNWKGIFLSVVVIGIVCVIIGVSAWLLQPPENPQDYKYVYDFDAMFDMEWRPYVTSGQWIGDSFIYRDRYQNVVKRTGREAEILIKNETLDNLAIYEATVSPDMKYALLSYNVEKVFRHSTTAQYYILTIATGSHVKLHSAGRLNYAAWGKYRNQLTYVFEADLYYKAGVQAPSRRITNSGEHSAGDIVNGITDWIYEEEMFSDTIAHWISHGGSYLGYVTFNDTLVPHVDIVLYNMPYPEVEQIKYPKAGYENPTVEVMIYDVRANRRMKILPPKSLMSKEPLLNSFLWKSDDTALVTWSNRYQNTSVITLCVISRESEFWDKTLPCKEVHEQEVDGWIEHIGLPPLPGPEDTFFHIEERSMGTKGDFHHLLLVDYKNPLNSRLLTSGIWEVTGIQGYSKRLNRVYYTSTETSPMDRHLYSVEITDPEATKICHTCGSPCRYITASLDQSASWALLNCRGSVVPYASLLDLSQGDEIILEENGELKERMQNAKMPEIALETITIDGEWSTYDLQAKLYLPVNAQLKSDIPLLVYIYGGPGSQKVNSRFYLDWTTYLVTNKDIAVLTFDARGSGYMGSKIMKEVNRRLGRFEVEDHIKAVRFLTKKYSFLSKTKIGVWGWSYGGYASAMLATHPWSLAVNLTKCVISVAPVTEWRLYDTIYTERYMGSPLNNQNHYMESSLLPRASYFNYFKFLLIHGTRDDNVHFQHSAVLETELVRAGVVHRYQVYTDEQHSLSSEAKWTQRHLYTLMTQFLMDCYHAT